MFEKVFVISLVNNFEKRKKIKERLDELGIEFEFIYGSNLYSIPTFRDLKQYGTDEPRSDYFIHAISCGLAHLNAIEYAYYGGYNNVLVIEDDCAFLEDETFIKDCLNNIPEDADVIQYGFLNLDGTLFNVGFNKGKYFYGAQMYALCNRKVMEDYLKSQHENFASADNIYIFKNDEEGKYNIYQVYPQLTIDKEHSEKNKILMIISRLLTYKYR